MKPKLYIDENEGHRFWYVYVDGQVYITRPDGPSIESPDGSKIWVDELPESCFWSEYESGLGDTKKPLDLVRRYSLQNRLPKYRYLIQIQAVQDEIIENATLH